ncbi:MAG TPA: hypothetical protein H9773_08895 [Candidatus Fournierella merdavium]|nr:hypothetical protein [Candidatus Fournierella merdavium]
MRPKTTEGLFFAAALAVCLLAGCGAPGPAPAAQGDAIRFLNPDSSYGSGTEAGYYYFTRDESGNSLLRFVDYATLQDVPLCSQPNCAHGDESCPAWFAYTGADVSVCAGDDALYIVYPGVPWNDWAFEAYGEKALPRIVKCGLDGANRQELVRFGAAEAFTCLPAADEKNLYAVVADYGEGTDAVKQIVTVDLATGGVSVDESVQRPELRIAGAWGRELILEFSTGQYSYAAYNVDTKALRELKAAGGSVGAAVGEGVLCRMDESAGAVHIISVEDGSTTELATDLLDRYSPEWPRLVAVLDRGYLVQGGEGGSQYNYLIDSEGKATRQELQAESTDDHDKMRMLQIFARRGEEYLTSPSRSYHTSRTPGPGGVTYGEEVADHAFALMGAEDFWNNAPNYRSVTRAG